MRHQEHFRVIKAVNLEQKEIYFLTNIWGLPPCQISEIYKSRWGIEIFFKYIKSYLNGRHFLSRSYNGIINVYFLRLIASILLIVFKSVNNLAGFKQAKWLFQTFLQHAALKKLSLTRYVYEPPP